VRGSSVLSTIKGSTVRAINSMSKIHHAAWSFLHIAEWNRFNSDSGSWFNYPFLNFRGLWQTEITLGYMAVLQTSEHHGMEQGFRRGDGRINFGALTHSNSLPQIEVFG